MAWKKGESGNPKGRPRSGNSLAEAIRRSVDLEDLVRRLDRIATKSPSEQTQLRAIEMLMERGYRKPAQVIEVGPVSEYDDLSDDELEQLEAEAQAELAASERLLAGETVETMPEGAKATARAGVLIRRRGEQPLAGAAGGGEPPDGGDDQEGDENTGT